MRVLIEGYGTSESVGALPVLFHETAAACQSSATPRLKLPEFDPFFR